MKKKRNWKLGGLALLTALTSFGALTSCTFFGDENAITIKRCDYVQNEDGSVTVTIVYENEDMKPLTFTIPAANGIKNITASYDEEENLVVKILTDKGLVYEFIVDAARGIDHIEYNFDEETGDTLVTVFYTDGTSEEQPIRIQKGDKGDPGVDGVDGKDGVGIAGIDFEQDETGWTTVFITMDDEEHTVYDFLIPPGVGIVDAKLETKGNKIIITLILSNGEKIPVEFGRNPTWFSGEGAPTLALDPIEGDFYYDTAAQIIYQFVAGQWKIVVDFGGQSTTDRRRVNFDLNAFNDEGEDDLNAHFAGVSATRRIRTEYCPKGHTFYDIHTEIPVPVRAGYDFLGWYAERNANPYIGGQFTSLTTVWSDITLYARWGEASESVEYHTVNFVLNAGDDESAAFEGVDADIRNLKVLVPAGKSLANINYALPKAVRDGYELSGFALAADGTDPLTVITPINSNLTAFAQWTPSNAE